MELWLLGAGAIVLIGITLWIVWPARTADDAVGTTVRGEEVSTLPMTDNARRGMPPQGDQFEDRYTSATADLSAGGVPRRPSKSFVRSDARWRRLFGV